MDCGFSSSGASLAEGWPRVSLCAGWAECLSSGSFFYIEGG